MFWEGRGAARLLRSLVVAWEAMLSIQTLINLSFSRSRAVPTWCGLRRVERD